MPQMLLEFFRHLNRFQNLSYLQMNNQHREGVSVNAQIPLKNSIISTAKLFSRKSKATKAFRRDEIKVNGT